MMDDNKYQSEILDAYDEGFNDGYQTAYEKYKYELAQLELKRDKKFKLGMC